MILSLAIDNDSQWECPLYNSIRDKVILYFENVTVLGSNNNKGHDEKKSNLTMFCLHIVRFAM